ncbi:MAG: flagellar basal-body MS-ring/collar protein FliF [Pseudomonadota bacterium]
MTDLNSVWSNLDMRRRLVVIGASLAVFASILFMAQGASRAQTSLLYAGLDSATAGDVLTALDQQGVPYEVRAGSIFVPTADRDRLRMTLAAQGLPANSAQGYELLDGLSGFGTTSQMFDAAYWRAKEGELARTMIASPHIRTARVHISAATTQPFRREETPTAAVTVTSVNGMLDASQADALRYLVASAVPGLIPRDVAVIDGVGGLIQGAGDNTGAIDANDRTEALRASVERLLAARVGAGNAVVEVSVDTVTETESIIERRFDPETRVAISTDIQESTLSSQDSRTGDVTIASNLPDGDGAGGDGAATNETSESRAVTNFEVSETQREVLRSPGAIRRISVAVLVNGIETITDTGEALMVPRPDEELADLERLVASAVGLDEARGDEITIRSMVFEPVPALGTDAIAETAPGFSSPLDTMQLIQTAVLAAVALILGLFVVRPILKSRAGPPLLDDSGAISQRPLAVAPPMAVAPATEQTTQAITGTIEPAEDRLPDSTVGGGDDPVDRLKSMIEERREDALQVLQSWIDEPKNSSVTGADK